MSICIRDLISLWQNISHNLQLHGRWLMFLSMHRTATQYNDNSIENDRFVHK